MRYRVNILNAMFLYGCFLVLFFGLILLAYLYYTWSPFLYFLVPLSYVLFRIYHLIMLVGYLGLILELSCENNKIQKKITIFSFVLYKKQFHVENIFIRYSNGLSYDGASCIDDKLIGICDDEEIVILNPLEFFIFGLKKKVKSIDELNEYLKN